MSIEKYCICFTLTLYLRFASGYWRDKDLAPAIRDEDVTTADEKWLQVPVDHHNADDKRTWPLRYFEDLRYFQPNGPIFIYLGGEARAYKEVFELCQILIELAYSTNGAMFIAEHRYYGESHPVEVTKADDMKYLSISQTLGDMITLVQALKALPQFERSKVVIIGGSYAGNLATWMRKTYPDYIDAAVASSAPLQAQVNLQAYLEAVAYTYKKHGSDGCMGAIRHVYQRYETLLSTPEGADQLKHELKICDSIDLNLKENQKVLFAVKSYEYAYTAMYGTAYDFLVDCYDLQTKNQLTRSQNVTCNNYEYGSNTAFYSKDQNDAWYYQMCTELGFFMTTDSNAQPFGHRIKVGYYHDRCVKKFGNEFNEERTNRGADYTNAYFGGREPNVTKVVFTHGGLDPWRVQGVLQDLSPDAPARVIPGVGHCKDLTRAGPNDPPELASTIEWAKSLIRNWIGL